MPALFVQTSGTLQTNSGTFVPIPGLALTLPEGVDITAVVIVNLPNPYASGNDYPGGTVGLLVNGQALPAFAAFTYGEQQPASFGRVPTTLVTGVPLTMAPQTIQAVWAGARGSTVIIDSPASLTAFTD